MFVNIENIQLISCCLGISAVCKKVTIRKTNLIAVWFTGPVEYVFEDREVSVRGGEMIFVPQGTSYTVRSPAGAEHRGIYLWFRAEVFNRKPKVYPMEKFAERGGFGVNLVTAWQSDSETDRLRCLSLFYSVLAHITAVDNACYADRKKYRIIEPAVEYLKQHIFDIDLKVDNLPELCGISGTYFRKIFQSEFGMTPQKYIINRRLSCARSILESGDFATVTEVAAAVGYADPLYFSQSFHKKYGFPPSQYRRIL